MPIRTQVSKLYVTIMTNQETFKLIWHAADTMLAISATGPGREGRVFGGVRVSRQEWAGL